MSIPVAYTPEELAAYMHTVLGKTATALGLSHPDSYAEAVNDCLLVYGVTVIAEATEIDKLRACARYTAWKAVWAEVAGDFDYTTDGQSFHRSQRVKHVAAMVMDAERDLDALGINPANVVEVTPIEHTDSQYVYNSEEVW